jgi:acyl-CoA thioesterase-1
LNPQADREILMNRDVIFILSLIFFFLGCGTTKHTAEEPAKIPPAPRPGPDLRPAIVAFGDSLTAGAGVQPDMNYPAKLQAKLDAAGYRYKVVNAGVSGDTSSQGLNRVQSVISLHPPIVIVEFGANDGLRGIPTDTTAQNLEAIISRIQSSGAKAVLAGMLVPPNYGPAYADSFRSIFPRVAKKTGAVLLPFFLDGVGGHPELNQEDGIHPTAEGYDIVVENVWKVLKPILE